MAGLVLAAPTLGQAPTPLDQLRASAAVRHAHIGVLAIDLEDDRVQHEHHADRAFLPASTLKLLTTAVALHSLGPDHRVTTELRRTGELRDGVLHGNLELVGGGEADPADPARQDVGVAPHDFLGALAVALDHGLCLPGPEAEPEQEGVQAVRAELGRERLGQGLRDRGLETLDPGQLARVLADPVQGLGPQGVDDAPGQDLSKPSRKRFSSSFT